MTEHDAMQADRDKLVAELNEERGRAGLLEENGRQIAWDREKLAAKLDAANARIAELERNGHTPMRDTVGGQITAEWDTPQEDAAWAHLGSDGESEANEPRQQQLDSDLLDAMDCLQGFVLDVGEDLKLRQNIIDAAQHVHNFLLEQEANDAV